MEWANEKALQLIDEYEKYPILWNAKHPEHYSRNKKADAWERIAYNLKVEEHEAKQKMNSLLGSFRRENAKGTKVLGQAKVGKMCMYRNGMHLKECITYLTKMNQENN
ncbi:unnamed protein product [Acanthoscelides obtectus]|uniref:MADF domain-containing protein n=1 Tax=Acanthoscelides obtectus TaxID=200917 RepID=A0A9P0Q6K8_ACAOB|nr:unnamed protein product [Acanthoscelides obtectus]CAK1622243.1 hypothetical protein AOBTE_LOCUS1392 [Acanthoscelides obtectus]